MNNEHVLADRIREFADRVEVPENLPGRALRAARRRRSRRAAGAVVVAVAVVAAGIGAGGALHRPAASPVAAGGRIIAPSPAHGLPQVTADTGHTLPHRVVGAGNLELAAVGIWPKGKGSPTWYLADRSTGRYRHTAYGWVSVAPGARVAAVLPSAMPSRRIGLLDLTTGQVRWVRAPHPVASVAWSPDGSKLLATAYRKNPDDHQSRRAGSVPSLRTGFVVVGMRGGADHPVPTSVSYVAFPQRNPMNAREDLAWSHDGSLLVAPKVKPDGSGPFRAFYTLKGQPHATPAGEGGYWDDMAGISPSGKYRTTIAKDKSRPEIAAGVREVRSGHLVSKLPVEQLSAWVNDDNLIGIQARPGGNEFVNRLVLVSSNGRKIIPLTGYDKHNLVDKTLEFART